MGLPTASLVVVREDLASVMAREEQVHNPGDQTVFIPANGFNLAATITTPSGAPAHAPAIVLVSGSGPQDRDCTTYGVPICGQLSGALAAAGYFVVRYDARGVGQSGGRTETPRMGEYGDDALRSSTGSGIVRTSILTGSRDRSPTAESAPIALVAAAHDSHISAVALLAAPGVTGRDLTLEQQQHLLSRLNIPDAEKAARVALEHQIINATLTSSNWDGLPPDAEPRGRHSRGSRSWLLFDPGAAIAKMHQPLFILQGALDTEMPPAEADRLEADSRARDRSSPDALTRKVMLSGVNHLLVPAKTGEMDEYGDAQCPHGGSPRQRRPGVVAHAGFSAR